VVEAALDSVAPSARARRITLETRIELAREQTYGDPDRLQQVLWNLLDNAVKFAPVGGTVWFSASADTAGALITVRDNGKGIAADFLPYVFDRFRQADASTTRRHQGLGLGLALVRHLTELHGGEIHAESPGPGKGATFTLRLPLRQFFPERADERRMFEDRAASLPSLGGYRVLVVDDLEEARESLAAFLGHAGATVLMAASCHEALRRLDELEGAAAPNVLVCDLAMPDQDGYATLRQIRDWELRRGAPGGQPMAAIALTAHSHEHDRVRALAGGFRMHLTKPISPAELIMMIALLGNGCEPERASPHPAVPPAVS